MRRDESRDRNRNIPIKRHGKGGTMIAADEHSLSFCLASFTGYWLAFSFSLFF